MITFVYLGFLRNAREFKRKTLEVEKGLAISLLKCGRLWELQVTTKLWSLVVACGSMW